MKSPAVWWFPAESHSPGNGRYLAPGCCTGLHHKPVREKKIFPQTDNVEMFNCEMVSVQGDIKHQL